MQRRTGRRPGRRAAGCACALVLACLGTACSGPASQPASQPASPPASASTARPTGGPASTPTGSSPASPSAPSSPAAATEVQVSVRDGEVTPPPGRVPVAVGDRVRLTVTSDVADELHVHGYDEEVSLRPGEPASLEFVADEAGLFEVETHESSLILLTLLVR